MSYPVMSPEKFVALQEQAGWTNNKAAGRLHVHERTVDNYRSGATKIPGPVALLFEQLVRAEVTASKRKA